MISYVPSLLAIIYVLSIYLFGLYLRSLSVQDYLECYMCKEMTNTNIEYDYIVVGSGTAGSIIARRLSENPNLKILLLEAGSRGGKLLEIPAVGVMLQESVYDWKYRTVPQRKACLGLEGRVSKWPMGKILGGTSMLNNMIYVRGHPEDYARWYKDSCNFNYSVDIQPYFEKLENYENPTKRSISIDDIPYRSNLSDYFLQAGLCLGFDIHKGLDSEPGFSHAKVTVRHGQRWTPFHQLESQKRSNLLILTHALVEKVLFRNDTEAYGVKYTYLEETNIAKAKKGVILSAGVIGTPKILMLSGIGPKKHLQKLKIPLKVDLPVGENLQDHITTGLDLVTLDFPPNLGIKQMLSPFSVFDYFIRKRGPWTTAGCEDIGFFHTDKGFVPELQFMIFPIGVGIDQGYYLRGLTGIGEKLYDKYFAKITRPSFSILPVVLHPKSRGTVKLKNKHPQSDPIIDPNYLSDQSDVDLMIQGIELIKDFIKTSPMRRLGAQLNTIKFPGCEKFEFDSRKYWECYIRRFTLTSYHPIGTCRMGDVVGYNFEVMGTRKLFVADGSILPDLPSGNPMGAIMMMAEKAAEVLKHRCREKRKSCCPQEIFYKECDCI